MESKQSNKHEIIEQALLESVSGASADVGCEFEIVCLPTLCEPTLCTCVATE